MKQTAVTWLEKKIDNLIPFQNELIAKEFNSFFEQAKAMEKEQMIKFANDYIDDDEELTAEQYYNQYYKQEIEKL